MNLPSAFIEHTRALLGKEEFEELNNSLKSDVPVSIRINEMKLCDKVIKPISSSLSRIPWSSSGFYLDERLTFTFDPLFHAGGYYVQEASSMFVEQIIKQYIHNPVIMLDLCAAPGGKSTHARSVLPEGSLLVANEVIRNRSLILAENLIKWGHSDIIVTNNDPIDFAAFPELFDMILADVPCSGEGMFRKDAEAINEWSLDNVNICRQRQRRIITDIWNSLKPGGILIYSTCTYNTKENEENIHWITNEFNAEALHIETDPSWNITGNLIKNNIPSYRFLPHKTKGEGFFIAAVRKPDVSFTTSYSDNSGKIKNKKQDKGKSNKTIPFPKEVKEWLLDSKEYVYKIKNNILFAFPEQHLSVLQRLSGLRQVHAGIILAEMKGKDLIPNHSLAMNNKMRRDLFCEVEVDYRQAISYLRKEAIVLSADIPRGYILLTYKKIPLGFVKNIGNRANNLYPNEWRIRSGFLPQEIKCLDFTPTVE